jgi:hypothetical protein
MAARADSRPCNQFNIYFYRLDLAAAWPHDDRSTLSRRGVTEHYSVDIDVLAIKAVGYDRHRAALLSLPASDGSSLRSRCSV